MKILVTGGAGFIGSSLVDRLLTEGHQVTVVDDLSGGYLKNLPEHNDLDFRQCDCRDFVILDDIMAETKPYVVYHLAANAAENKAQFSPVDISSRGYMASINVATSAIRAGVKKFIFTSSIAVYGGGQLPFSESSKPEPEDLYGIGKYAFEQSLKVLCDVHEMEYVILRPHNVYGPRQNMADPYRNVVTIFMNHLMQDKQYVLYGDGKMVRCFTYIDDLTECLYKSLDLSNVTINVGASTPHSVLELSNMIQEVTKIWIAPKLLPARPHEVLEAVSDHTLSQKYFPIKETQLKEGLEKTWEWVKVQGPVETHYDTIEIIKNLPTNWK